MNSVSAPVWCAEPRWTGTADSSVATPTVRSNGQRQTGWLGLTAAGLTRELHPGRRQHRVQPLAHESGQGGPLAHRRPPQRDDAERGRRLLDLGARRLDGRRRHRRVGAGRDGVEHLAGVGRLAPQRAQHLPRLSRTCCY